MRSASAPLRDPEAESLSWSAKDRDRALDQAEAGGFDLIIIGGGITGAGVAREAALRRIPFEHGGETLEAVAPIWRG